MPIDLDGLAVIDTILDTAIELLLLPETWSEEEVKILNHLHRAVLRLNQLWTEEDTPSGQFIHDIKPVISIVLGYLEMFELSASAATNAILSPYSKKLKHHTQLLSNKIDFFVYQLNFSSQA